MDKKVIVTSLALDLRRVAQGLYRRSASASVFEQEALKRGAELEKINPDEYLKKLWNKTKNILKNNNRRKAEDILMLSTLFQNFAVRRLK